jgi:hypothetical protein|tara:strand:+ start:290 stop:559 length:270 start_codon:yes stop_codon:yes gene_type:complete
LGLDKSSIETKETTMLRKLYKAMVLAQAASAANRTAAYLTDHQLQDWGYTRGTFAAETVAQIKAELDAVDQAKVTKSGYQSVAFSQLPA